jgi:phosphoribosylaminoimidazole-succinocarboxamide synthase
MENKPDINIKKLEKDHLIFDGTTKKLFSTNHPDYIFMEFKNDLAVKDKKKSVKIRNKAQNNLLVSSYTFQFLESYHVPTHYIGKHDDKTMVVKKLDMIPVFVVVKNIASGLFSKTFKLEEGFLLSTPIIEFYLKDPRLGFPLVNEYHLYAFGHSHQDEVKLVQRLAAKINALLKNFFDRRGYKLVECTMEFGRYHNGIILGDEITLETQKVWEITNDRKMDKEIHHGSDSEISRVYTEFKDRIVSHKIK